MIVWLIFATSAAAAGGQPIAAQPVTAVIDHIGLHVANPITSAAFYQRILGLQPFAQNASPTMRWVGSTTFQLHLIGGRTKAVDTATETHFAFRVTNLDDELKVLDRNHVSWTIQMERRTRSRGVSTGSCRSTSRTPMDIRSKSTRRQNKKTAKRTVEPVNSRCLTNGALPRHFVNRRT